MKDAKRLHLWQAEERLDFARKVADFVRANQNELKVSEFVNSNRVFQNLKTEVQQLIQRLITQIFSFEENVELIRSKISQGIIEVINGGIRREALLLYVDMLTDMLHLNLDALKMKIISFLKNKSDIEISGNPFLAYLKQILININSLEIENQEGSDIIHELFDIAFSTQGISPFFFDADPNTYDTFEKILKGKKPDISSIQIIHPGSDKNN